MLGLTKYMEISGENVQVDTVGGLNNKFLRDRGY